MQRSLVWQSWAALVSAALACGDATSPGPPPPADVTSSVDVEPDAPVDVAEDASAVDAPPTDLASGDRPVADVPADRRADADEDGGADSTPSDVAIGVGPCAPGTLIDLNARGTTVGATTRFVGDNLAADETVWLAAPCGGTTAHQVALRYTPRSRARLHITTDNPGTAMNFDTVVWALPACSVSATAIACNDDGAGATRAYASTLTTDAPAVPGEPVFIVVAGYIPTTTRSAQGAFELTVTELATVAVGATCDPTGAVNVCAAGSICVRRGASATCVADGAAGGVCRTGAGATPCDAGSRCVVDRCQPIIPVGMPCNSLEGICATGSSCRGLAGQQHCIAVGAPGGICRSGTGVAPCDPGLVCSGIYCGTPIPAGTRCGMPGVFTACEAGTRCTGAPGAERCAADGAASGGCRASSPQCDAGLTCVFSTCVHAIAAGGACDLSAVGQRCAEEQSCAPTSSGATCQADGTVAGASCRTFATPLCDAGLTCNGRSGSAACRRAGAAGMSCDLVYDSVACPTGTVCLAASATAATCAATRPEMEPNSAPTMPQAAISTSTAFSGSVGGAADPTDCFAITVPANGGVTIVTDTPGHTGCELNNTELALYGPTGALLASNDYAERIGLCSRIVMRSLPAGTYVSCLTPYLAGGLIEAYTLSIGVFGP